jgi:ribosomal protein L13E
MDPVGNNFSGVSQGGTPNVSAPVSAPATPTQEAPAANSTPTLDLAAALRTEMQARFAPEGLVSLPDNSLPAGLLDGTQQESAGAEAQAKTAGENGQPQPGQPQEPVKTEAELAAEAEAAKIATGENEREELTAIHLERFGRDFSLSEVEAAIEGFNYYHPKAMKLQEDIQRLQGERQEIESLKTSPEMQLAFMLKSDPALREKFREIARAHNPQGIARQEENQELAAVKAELARVKESLEQGQKAVSDKETAEKQANWQRHIVNVTKEVDQTVNKKLESIKQSGVELSEAEIDYITQNAVASVKAGQLKYEPAALAAYYSRAIDFIAQKAIAARNQSIAGYQQTKKTLPPPPPTGGAAPVIQPDSPSSFGEFQNLFANRLESALNQL